jgi:hypothetical protein
MEYKETDRDSTMKDFFKMARRLGLCREYTAKWASCKTKRQLMDVALDANGLPWVAGSIADGWGLSQDYIEKEFFGFLNGRYVHDNNGYTSAIYVNTAFVPVHTTAALVIGCHGEIHTDRLCELHVVDSSVSVTGESACNVYLYNSTVTNMGDTKARIKQREK